VLTERSAARHCLNLHRSKVASGSDHEAITSGDDALLLGETDRAIRLTSRFATCFTDAGMVALIEHAISTIVQQRVVASRWAAKT
jgi:hypothetical protein